MNGENPQGLSNAILATMPEGARLLEEGERIRFYNYSQANGPTEHPDLWRYVSKKWISPSNGSGGETTYCTTRPRGWWKAKPDSGRDNPMLHTDDDFWRWWHEDGKSVMMYVAMSMYASVKKARKP